MDTLSNQDLVELTNSLARDLYGLLGNVVDDDFKFYEATHPQEVMCWDMAVTAAEKLRGADVEDALSEVLEE